MPRKQQKIKLRQSARESIISLYRNIAYQLGLDPDGRYKATKILVAQNIQDEIYDYYRTLHSMPDYIINMLWFQNGPKVDPKLKENEVIIQDGWYMEAPQDEQ